MKRFAVLSTIFLSALLAFAIPVLAQQEDHDKPAQEEEKRQPDVKPPKPEEKRVPQEEKQAKQDDKHEQQEKKVEQKAQRADDHARRIPDDRFRAHFGHEHSFVINRVTVVNGAPRFQYGGYWFAVVDPWPVEWAYTDECYIDDIDGEYFLFDLAHPGVKITLFVVL